MLDALMSSSSFTIFSLKEEAQQQKYSARTYIKGGNNNTSQVEMAIQTLRPVSNRADMMDVSHRYGNWFYVSLRSQTNHTQKKKLSITHSKKGFATMVLSPVWQPYQNGVCVYVHLSEEPLSSFLPDK